MPFKKGAKPGPGRPKGSLSRSFLDVSLWLGLIYERIPQMTFDQQVENSWRAVNALMPKIPALPAVPGDSVSNAAAAVKLLNGIENLNPPLETPIQPLPAHSNGGSNGG